MMLWTDEIGENVQPRAEIPNENSWPALLLLVLMATVVVVAVMKYSGFALAVAKFLQKLGQ